MRAHRSVDFTHPANAYGNVLRKSLADVDALAEKERASRPTPKSGGKRGLSAAAEKEKDDMRSLEVEDFFAKAIERSYSAEDPK